MANGASIKEEHFVTDEPFDIPEDCYHIIGVYSGTKLLSKSSPKQHIKGQYRIENNKILFVKFMDTSEELFSILDEELIEVI